MTEGFPGHKCFLKQNIYSLLSLLDETGYKI